MPSLVSEKHLGKVKAMRLLMAAYAHSEDLIRVGAYQKGSDPTLDKAMDTLPALNAFLQQTPALLPSFNETVNQLMAIPD
jgi:flagellum-specific ATP synthase